MQKSFFSKAIASAVISAGLLAAGAASAATTLVLSPSGDASYNQTFDAPTSFSDEYLFTIGSGTIGDATGSIISGTVKVGKILKDNVTFSSITFFKVNGDGTHTDLSTTVAGNYFFPDSALATGNYGFTVAGFTSIAGAGGSYGGNLHVDVSAVPEPATYGMLLGGLGLLGVAARRKKGTQA